MALGKDELYRLIERLNEIETHTVYDFMNYLLLSISRAKRSWQVVAGQSPDTDPLTKEEQEQLENKQGYVSWEEAKRKLGL